MIRLARVGFLLILASPLAAQIRISYSSLGASNVTLRFFPSLAAFPVAAERVYPATFDSATTHYINVELGFDYPKVASGPVSFTLNCRYNGPQGENEGTPTVTGTIQAGWTGSQHAGGWGSNDGGNFPVGSYQVSCRDGITVVVAGHFTVTRDRFDVPEVRGMVVGIRMYEGPTAFLPLDQRVYAGEFDGGKARVLKTELQVIYPETSTRITYTIDCALQFPNGKVTPFALDVYADAGWTGARHSNGVGTDRPGGWDKGIYSVTCKHQGSVVAQRTFTVY